MADDKSNLTVKYKKNEHAQLNIHYHRKSLKKSAVDNFLKIFVPFPVRIYRLNESNESHSSCINT